MAKTTTVLRKKTVKNLHTMGGQIKNARLRRNIKASNLAEMAGVGLNTLNSIEKGAPSVSIGKYAAVLAALGDLDEDFLLIARDDVLGRVIQDENLPKRVTSGPPILPPKKVTIKKKR